MVQDIVPIGMVDELAATPRVVTPVEKAMLAFVLKTGPRDMALLASFSDPAIREAQLQSQLEQRARDWPNLGMYRGDNAALTRSEPPKVVFMGDSITEMWRYADPTMFSNGIVGRGISGQTAPQMVLRFYADVVALKPRAVHLLCGANDIAGNTGPSTPDDYRHNVLAMLDLAQFNQIDVVIGSILPAGFFVHRPEVKPIPRIAELNQWLVQISQERGVRYIDYFAAMAAADGSMREALTNDGLHPNRAGYAVMRPLALATLAPFLASA